MTGGTGLIGSAVLRLLSQQGVPARTLAWPETLPAAFEGAGTLFLLTGVGEDTVALQHNAIAAARAAGVTRLVKLSAFGASDHSQAPICLMHYQVEKEMRVSGVDWTILRPHHFMYNLLALFCDGIYLRLRPRTRGPRRSEDDRVGQWSGVKRDSFGPRNCGQQGGNAAPGL